MVKTEEETNSVLSPTLTTSPGEAMSVDVKAELPDQVKSEPPASPAPSNPMDFDDDAADSKRTLRSSKSSSSASPPLEDAVAVKKQRASPPTTASRKPPANAVQLIGDLPISRKEALATFKEITHNNYQNKSIGRSKEMFESMTCDCVYEHGEQDMDDACGPWSDCINRLTQVECLPDDCRCRQYCQNQRFQKRQYANIEIVLTELKGFGLRAEESIPKDTFIYEYVGDVVSPPNFKKRMRDYALEGIQHFYFMMLQKDEFIDATKSGGIGRFANHSCNPNCYVAKWTVGNYVRMGIFSKRDIQKHEELTFNYNVDRYGHQAQTCYCGEPNCVGFIGGKTQTDIVTMDDLYLDALGITDEDDVAALKGTKKKRGKKIDDLDFMPQSKPVVEKEVPKVVQAIRQTTSRKVLLNLLTRVKVTEDQAALRQIMRLRGYSVMKNILDDWVDDFDLVETVIQCMKTWPLLNRNKVDDSMIAGSVEVLLEKHTQESFQTLVRELLEHWKGLPVYNRIKKTKLAPGELRRESPPPDNTKRKAKEDIGQFEAFLEQRKREMKKQLEHRMSSGFNNSGFFGGGGGNVDKAPAKPATPVIDVSAEHRQSLKDIIAQAAARDEEQRRLAAAEAEEKAKKEAERAERHAKRKAKAAKVKERERLEANMTEEEKAAEREKIKEKRLMKLIGAVVVRYMGKHARELSREIFKKYARELTTLLTEKEKKSPNYPTKTYDTLPDEKVMKIKRFAKDYLAKLFKKLQERGKLPPSSSTSTSFSSSSKNAQSSSSSHRNGHSSGNANGQSHNRPSVSLTPTNATASSSTHTPKSVDGGDAGANEQMVMSVEEAMGMEPDSDADSEADAEGELEEEDMEGEPVDEASTGGLPDPTGQAVGDRERDSQLGSDRQTAYAGEMRPPPLKRQVSIDEDRMDVGGHESGAPGTLSEFGYGGQRKRDSGWGQMSADPRRRVSVDHPMS